MLRNESTIAAREIAWREFWNGYNEGMSSIPQRRLISEEDLSQGELDSPIKHEYLGGYVYAMAGARNRHNRITTNILGAFFQKLDGKPCQPFNSDTKVRAKWKSQTRFYYPDVSIICQENPENDSFQDNPAVIVEVSLSKRTRRIDEGEKKDVYLTIPSLDVYLLVEQEQPLRCPSIGGRGRSLPKKFSPGSTWLFPCLRLESICRWQKFTSWLTSHRSRRTAKNEILDHLTSSRAFF